MDAAWIVGAIVVGVFACQGIAAWWRHRKIQRERRDYFRRPRT
jgi:hypothetical protein